MHENIPLLTSKEALDKAEVLAALFNAAGHLNEFVPYQPHTMTHEEAATFLRKTKSFGFVWGRMLNVDLTGDALYPWGYDREHGLGSCERVIAELWRRMAAQQPVRR